MITLAQPAGRHDIVDRIGGLCASDRAAWGRMSVHQMICHLADAYRVPLGERTVSPATGVAQRTLIKWIALWMPVKWMKGFPTRPEMEQGKGGTVPVEFELDKAALLWLVQRLCDELPQPCAPHPVFGDMNAREWLRWGYLHADHHLRQFGR